MLLPNFVFIGLITLAIIFSFYKYRKQTIVKNLTEGLANRNPNQPQIRNRNQNQNQNQNQKQQYDQYSQNQKYYQDDNQYDNQYDNQDDNQYDNQDSTQYREKTNKHGKKITQSTFTTNPVTLESVLRSDFHQTTKQNPFGNVLLTDIMDEPHRKAAAPSFNPDVSEDITSAVKKQTQMLNPSIDSTNKQLYGDLKDNYDLDKSMMRFYSTANTRVTNDQGAYSQFLFGSMFSSKEDTPEGAMMRTKNSYRYTL